MINTLNITYPSNANPTLYIYIVPDDRYSELLNTKVLQLKAINSIKNTDSKIK